MALNKKALLLGTGAMAIAWAFSSSANAQQNTLVCTETQGINGDFECGAGAKADGIFSTAVGGGATTDATSFSATAIGSTATVGSNASSGTAIGTGATIADGFTVSTALGANSKVEAASGTALGASAKILTGASSAVALGQGSIADEKDTISVGSNGTGNTTVIKRRIVNVADAQDSDDALTKGQFDARLDGGTVKFGFGATIASGVDDSVVIGAGASATAKNSVAIGAGSTAGAVDVVSVGVDGLGGLKRKIVNVAAGSADNDAVNVLQMNSAISGLQLTLGTNSINGPDLKISTLNGPDKTISGVAAATQNNQAVNKFQMDQQFLAVNTNLTNRLDGARVIFGNGAQGAGTSAVSVGAGANAVGNFGVALGNGAVVQVQAANSVALGDGSIAAIANTVSVGGGSGTPTRRIVNVAAGQSANEAATFGQIQALDLILTPAGAGGTGTAVPDLKISGNSSVDKTISGVAAAVDGNDAVNFNQLIARSQLEAGLAVASLGLTSTPSSPGVTGNLNIRSSTLARTISGVAAATADDMAVNKAQMLSTIDANITSAFLGHGLASTSSSQGNVGDLSIKSNGFDRTITGVAAAIDGNQAVNKSQMDARVDALGLTATADNLRIATVGEAKVLSGVATAQAGTDAVNKDQMEGAINGLQLTLTSAGAGGTGTANPDVKISTLNGPDKTISGVAAAIDNNDAVNKGQMDTTVTNAFATRGLASSNGSLAVSLGGSNRTISGVANAINSDDAVNKGQMEQVVSDSFVSRGLASSGGNLSVSLGTTSRTISGVANAFNSDQAVNKGQMELAVADAFTTRGLISGANNLIISIGGTNRTISGLANAVDPDQAVNKGQMEAAIGTGVATALTTSGFTGTATTAAATGNVNFALGGDRTLSGVAAATAGNQAVNLDQLLAEIGLGVADGIADLELTLSPAANGRPADLKISRANQPDKTISGVAAAIDDNDAVNLAQMNTAIGDGIDALGLTVGGADFRVAALNASRTISGVANAILADQAINKGQFDAKLNADRVALGTGAAATFASSVVIGNGTTLVGSATNDGTGNIAIGAGAKATNVKAVAIGQVAIAQGFQTTSVGVGAKTSGNNGSAFGKNAQALGNDVTGIGANISVFGGGGTGLGAGAVVDPLAIRGVAIGRVAKSLATDSVALGAKSVADQANTVSVGSNGAGGTTAFKRRIVNVAAGVGADDAVNKAQLDAVAARLSSTSVKIGLNAGAKAGTTAIGSGAVASGDNSVALGAGSTAIAANTVSVGTTAAGGQRRIVNVAAGTAATDAINKGQFDAVANRITTSAVKVGLNAGAIAGSAALGSGAVASGSNSVALGAGSTALVANVVSVGTSAAGGQRRIVNVAAGTGDNDAVNFKQMRDFVTAQIAGFAGGAPVSLQTVSLRQSAEVAPAPVFASLVPPSGTGAVADATSVAIGDNADASGIQSVAVGQEAKATGESSSSLGFQANASGKESQALGFQSTATALHAVALGGKADATANAATAVGWNADANGLNSTAVGDNSDATADNSTALGKSAKATALNSIAIGQGAIAGAEGSIALGQGADTGTFTNSVAVGTGTKTAANNEVNVGGRTIGGVANAVLATDAVNLGQMNAALAGLGVSQLDGRIDALEEFAQDASDRIARANRRASSGTAVAAALSGGMFLPDKSFNLTGNVAAYEGAYAAALQLGALINESTAFNAGISHGFNKEGKTAVRAGFTFGW